MATSYVLTNNNKYKIKRSKAYGRQGRRKKVVVLKKSRAGGEWRKVTGGEASAVGARHVTQGRLLMAGGLLSPVLPGPMIGWGAVRSSRGKQAIRQYGTPYSTAKRRQAARKRRRVRGKFA